MSPSHLHIPLENTGCAINIIFSELFLTIRHLDRVRIQQRGYELSQPTINEYMA